MRALTVAAPALIAAGAAGLVACLGAFGSHALATHRAREASRRAFEQNRRWAGEMITLPGEAELPELSIDKTEVTVAAYRVCVGARACTAPARGALCNWDAPGRDDHPVNCVDQPQAAAFCAWTGRRLPTSAEWRRAASGRASRRFPWGETSANRQDCFGRLDVRHGGTCPVGSYPAGATPEGVLGLGGNVSEWTSSELAESTQLRSNRWIHLGASWIDRTHRRERFESAYESIKAPNYRDSVIGFRCVRPSQL